MASETWSAILSGWASVTDSEVNKKRSLKIRIPPLKGFLDACRETPGILECGRLMAMSRIVSRSQFKETGRARQFENAGLQLWGKTNLYRKASAWGAFFHV